ncbi:protein terminal ear1 homolog [Salvia miltiorrhiza]|uniref:protein terminal ear1 homolog n=1 Tax=Salvia miltiorrhiza TaxID=226208 RepID=UPI0025AC7FB9|nr:protein terminal ear1 homolog [Salvia miltiorrhiza]
MLDGFCLVENHKAGNEATSGEEAHIAYAYDFLYLPIDFKSKRSRGFAFVNFTSSRAVWSFYDSIHLTDWGFLEKFKWKKRIEIGCAKIQGKEELVKHFSGSVFQCGTDEYLPVCFSPARDGSGQPVELTVVGNRRYNH